MDNVFCKVRRVGAPSFHVVKGRHILGPQYGYVKKACLMLFNSLVFFVFLPAVFGIYWALGRWGLRVQNLFVVVASYFFYGWWDWRFLLLIALTSAVAWGTGLLMVRSWRRLGLWLSVIVNLGVLGFFKYFDFFAASAAEALGWLGVQAHVPTLRLLLPVGISFYTFQAMSYTFDVWRGTLRPVRDPVAFFAFVSFFPQLVAGPIERATHLLPQFLAPRRFDHAEAVAGCRLMLWGFFKKVLVADLCAAQANALLGAAEPSTLSLWVGVFCFTMQIYGDFSGYSDIAIGCGRLFGIRLSRNFAQPYFSRDIAEFWRRWHISLTTWFRDYLYIPLGGSRAGRRKSIRNTFAVFLTSGLWHGANWTFLAWGAFHAVCFLPLLLRGKNRRYLSQTVAEGRRVPSPREAVQMGTTFLLAMVGWVFFRAPTLGTAGVWLRKMFLAFDFRVTQLGLGFVWPAFVAAGVLLLLEWCNRGRESPRLPENRWLRWGVYYAAVCAIVFLRPEPQGFVYFQF